MSNKNFELPRYNLPEFKTQKNGYEIRTEILAMAKDLVANEYTWKYNGWEISAERDDKGAITSTVRMPEFPGLEHILATAQRMYDFVSAAGPKPIK